MSLEFTPESEDSEAEMKVRLEACECGTCKNFFFIAKTEVMEWPTFCCFCGCRIESIREADLGNQLRSFFGGSGG